MWGVGVGCFSFSQPSHARLCSSQCYPIKSSIQRKDTCPRPWLFKISKGEKAFVIIVLNGIKKSGRKKDNVSLALPMEQNSTLKPSLFKTHWWFIIISGPKFLQRRICYIIEGICGGDMFFSKRIVFAGKYSPKRKQKML